MSEPTRDQILDSMTGPSSTEYAKFGPTLKGAGADAWTAWQQLSKATSELPSTGRSAAAEIARISADDSLPQDHRNRITTEAKETAAVIVDKLHAAAQSAAKNLEQNLATALRPLPSRDSGERILRRQELSNMLAGATGADLPVRALKLLGKNPAWDAELLSDHGRSLFEAQGVADQYGTFESGATGILLHQIEGGTEKQQAARRALKAFRDGNISGRTAAFYQAARMALGQR